MEETLTDIEMQNFAEIAYRELGIRISSQKKALMSNRLGRRVRELKLPSFKAYYDYLVNQFNAEIQHFTDAVTTNETYFFRGPRHFHTLAKRVLPELKGETVEVWSAASSTGEEPYSLAIALLERLPNASSRKIKVYASDINMSVLKKASEGIFGSYALRLVKPEHLQKYFSRLDEERYKITPTIRKMVHYGHHNLIQPFPKGKLDFIFCRNVLIYFDEKSKKIVFHNLINALKPGGYLFLGESEIAPELVGMHRIEASVVQKKR